jgi:NhaP-type Na+/H+ or K+/H+ antiporter
MLFFIALAAAKVEVGLASLSQFIVEQLGDGLLVGLGIGLCGGWLPGPGKAKKLGRDSFLQVGVVTLPLICMGISELVGAGLAAPGRIQRSWEAQC